MDWNLVQASWQRFRVEVYANWGRFTGSHLAQLAPAAREFPLSGLSWLRIR
jgi:hypothetical protein